VQYHFDGDEHEILVHPHDYSKRLDTMPRTLNTLSEVASEKIPNLLFIQCILSMEVLLVLYLQGHYQEIKDKSRALERRLKQQAVIQQTHSIQ